MTNVSLKVNEEFNGIELYFTGKPQQSILETLKTNRFRWHRVKSCWYAKQSDAALKVAESLVNGSEVVEVVSPIQTQVKQPKKVSFNLWNACQFDLVVTKEQRDQEPKLIAKEIRQHLKNRFPMVKFSVRTKSYDRMFFDIVSAPFTEDSEYLKAVLNYCKELVNAYKYCTYQGDPYQDIASDYNFHCWPEVAYNYEQTEVTEEDNKLMSDFDAKLEAFNKAEEERKEAEFQTYLQEQAIRDAEYAKQREEESNQIDAILNNIQVKELNETEQYYVLGSQFANLNKNNTLDEYKEEVSKGDYTLENVMITKEVHFNNVEDLNNFSNMLLTDFDFLTNTGGSFTNDKRFTSMTDFDNMSKEERDSIQWNLKGVAIYFNGKLQFIVDAQGYSYARYVGLVENVTIEKDITENETINNEELEALKLDASRLEDISFNVIAELNIMGTWNSDHWEDYKEAIKCKLNEYNMKLTKAIIQQLEIDELKIAMYKLLTEVDSIQEQFKDADIQQGEKVTLFHISDWGNITTSRVTFDSVENTKYAQYDNAVKLTYKPENKRKLYYNHFYKELLVFKGWHSLPETVLHNIEERNGFTVISSKYHSCDHKQYDEILNYFESQGLHAIINTYKPTF